MMLTQSNRNASFIVSLCDELQLFISTGVQSKAMVRYMYCTASGGDLSGFIICKGQYKAPDKVCNLVSSLQMSNPANFLSSTNSISNLITFSLAHIAAIFKEIGKALLDGPNKANADAELIWEIRGWSLGEDNTPHYRREGSMHGQFGCTFVNRVDESFIPR